MTVERTLRLIAGAFVMLPRAGLLGFALLVFVHRFRRPEPISVRSYQLVSDDDNSAQVGCQVNLSSCALRWWG